MWASHAGGGGHGLPRAARQGTRQVDVKSATRGVLTGASGQRCVRAHGLRCRCCCGAVRECVGRVCVWSVACVALVWLLLCRAQAGAVRSMQGVVAPVAQLDAQCPLLHDLLEHFEYSACCGCHIDGCARSGGAACRGARGGDRGGGGDRARGSWAASVGHARMPLRRRRRSFRALPPLVRSHLRRVMSARTSWPRRSREFSQPMRTCMTGVTRRPVLA